MSDLARQDVPSAERRRSVRSPVRLRARYVSSNLHLEGLVVDVTPEGMFFRSDFLDAEGELARLWVELPSRPGPIELRCEVRWVNETPYAGGMGIRLLDVSAEVRALLSSLVDGGASPWAADAQAGHA